MGHGKETPRQKMIGMMYLVLTALLALNVSAEILNAFILVDKSLGKTTENFKQKNEDIYSKFMSAWQENKVKVAPYKDKADKVKVKTQELIDYVYSLKTTIVEKADGAESKYKSSGYDPQKIQKKDDNNIPSEVMILNKKGEELKGKLEEYKKFLLSLVDDKNKYKPLIEAIERTLDLSDTKSEDGQTKAWEEANFHHLPLAAVTTMLTKVQSDLRNTEGDIINYLISQIDAGTFKFTKIEAVVKANSSYLLKGQKYEAEVFIAASDTSVKPEIVVGGRSLEIKNGKGIYNGGTESVGLKNWGGVIKLKSPKTGEMMEFPFKTEYQVGEPGLVVSPTKMNVFYVGVDNPVEVSVSGVPDDKVKVSISNGEIRKSGNGYVVRVKGPSNTETNIRVSADFGGGAVKDMGAKKFRVKTVPDPKPFMLIGDKRLDPMIPVPAEKLAYGNLDAVLENFDFDLKFKITKFTVSTTIKGFNKEETSENGRLSSTQATLIKQAGSSSKVYFENIVAKGPDGTDRKLGTLVYKLR